MKPPLESNLFREPPIRKHRVYLGLGANLGDPARQLQSCLRSLSAKLDLFETSSLYRTQPVSSIPQPWYLNLVASGSTELSPYDLLEFLQSLERSAGRTRLERDGPRTLDIDLLLYGNLELQDPQLALPHPRMRQRRFVLAPLVELSPHLVLPGDEISVADLLRELPPGEEVQIVDWPST